MRASTGLPWVIAGLVCATLVAAAVLDAGAGRYASGAEDVVLGVLAIAATTTVGLLLAVRRPANPIGWLLLANGVALTLAGLAPAYAGYALQHPGSLPGGRAAAIWDTTGWPLLFAGVIAVAFVFPDGRLPSARWRPVVAGAIASFLLTLSGGLLSDNRLDAPFDGVRPFDALPAAVSGAMQGVGLLGMFATFVLAMVALVRRYRGAAGELRSQLKWIAYAGALIPVSIAVGTVDGGGAAPGLPTTLALAAVEIAIPVAIGVAVLRYRLYEIDRLINATLVYGFLTALLALAFVTVSVGLGVALGGGSALPTAAATLVVTIAFRPLRARVQTAVDRRFNAPRYLGLQQVDRFLAELREGRAEPEAVGGVLADALADPGLALFFWLPHDGAHADARGAIVQELPHDPPARTPVRRGELELAMIVHDPSLAERPSVLESVIARAGLAIEIARLRVEVRRQLSQVEQSRARIVAAGYEERRRLERDLHDGAQQRLVSLGLELRHVQHRLEPASVEAHVALDAVVTGLREAIAELRELARGVRPATLEGGLAPALRELAARAPIRTRVDATADASSATSSPPPTSWPARH